MVFDSLSYSIDEVLPINPSAAVFVFGDYKVHHKDWLTYSGGTDKSSELCYNISVTNDLTQMVNFPNWIPDCYSRNPALLDAIVCSAVAFPPMSNSDHVFLSVSTDFPSNSQQDAPFHRIAYAYFCTEWDSLCDHLRDISSEGIF